MFWIIKGKKIWLISIEIKVGKYVFYLKDGNGVELLINSGLIYKNVGGDGVKKNYLFKIIVYNKDGEVIVLLVVNLIFFDIVKLKNLIGYLYINIKLS